ncbi:MAG: twin transmembrane helix small protein [Inhella sp.]
MTWLLLIALLGILASLALAGFFMLRRPGPDDKKGRMARALALRVALSISLFLFVLLAWAMGWIEPRGVPLGH